MRVNGAIYWLLLYATNDRGHVALVTEVPGNPGPNSMNGLEAIVDCLEQAFRVDPLRLALFTIWPSGYTGSTAKISRVLFDGAPRWSTVRRAVIEDLVGTLPPIPDHQVL